MIGGSGKAECNLENRCSVDRPCQDIFSIEDSLSFVDSIARTTCG
jgi:hypothetical protein